MQCHAFPIGQILKKLLLSFSPLCHVAHKRRLAASLSTVRTVASCSTTLRGETNTTYRLLTPLGKPCRDSNTSNIWKAIDDSSNAFEYVAKGPPSDDDENKNWPAFQHELSMQRLFAQDKFIRSMVDLVPVSQPGGPLMILKPFQMTLWEARSARRMTIKEIKWIMEGCLFGIMTVHRKDLVYTGTSLVLTILIRFYLLIGPRSQDGECWHKRL